MDGSNQKDKKPIGIARRDFMKAGGALGLATFGASFPAPFVHAARPIKVGYVSPRTGPLAFFADSDDFNIGLFKKAFTQGIKIDGKAVPVEFIYKDSQSNSNRCAEVTADLILKDGVDIVIASSTPTTTNPVADQCEINGVPCLTAGTPWQPYFFGRGGDPKKPFNWTYHYFWGLEDLIASHTNLWSLIPTERNVGALWPNDDDGNAFGSDKIGFPPALATKGYKLFDKGRYQTPSDDFSSYIIDFKAKGVDIVTGVMPPPDFANFWSQAGQQGFKPKIVTMPKASEFPATIGAFGDRAEGLSVELAWSPWHPFNSSITGAAGVQIAKDFTAETNLPWNFELAFRHSLLELVVDVMKRAGGPGKPEAIRDAIKTLNQSTLVGPINFSKGPVANVCKTPLVSGQWQRRGKGFDILVVENSLAPEVPLQSQLQPIK